MSIYLTLPYLTLPLVSLYILQISAAINKKERKRMVC